MKKIPTSSSMLRAAPFDDLVKQMCTNNIDAMQILEVLQLFPRYATRNHLFETIRKLASHYSTVYGALKVLLVWCTYFFQRDFVGGLRSKLLNLILQLSSTVRRNTLGSSIFLGDCVEVLNKIKLRVLREAKPKVPTPRANIVIKPTSKNITAHTALEVAQQLTKLEHILFSQIHIQEFTGYPKHVSLKLKAFIDRFNNLTNWVTTHVTRRSNDPVPAMIYFIKIAHYCEIMGNYNSTFTLYACLSGYDLTKLMKAFRLPRKYQSRLTRLEHLFDPISNYRTYRNLIKEKQSLAEQFKYPFLPYVGLLLKDLTFVHEANPDLINSNVNVEKINMLGNIYKSIRLCQSLSYESMIPTVNRGLYDSLLSLDTAPSKQLNRMSLCIRSKKLADTLNQVDAVVQGLPPVCSSGTLSTSDGPVALNTFIDFLASGNG